MEAAWGGRPAPGSRRCSKLWASLGTCHCQSRLTLSLLTEFFLLNSYSLGQPSNTHLMCVDKPDFDRKPARLARLLGCQWHLSCLAYHELLCNISGWVIARQLGSRHHVFKSAHSRLHRNDIVSLRTLFPAALQQTITCSQNVTQQPTMLALHAPDRGAQQ